MKTIKTTDTYSLHSAVLKKGLIPASFVARDFQNLKNKILGKKYDISIALVGNKKSKSLNKEYRGKDYAPDVLSFPISNESGQIFINPHVAKRKAPQFEMNYEKYLIYLVIHGMLHLKGLEHGAKMDKAEKVFLRYFN